MTNEAILFENNIRVTFLGFERQGTIILHVESFSEDFKKFTSSLNGNKFINIQDEFRIMISKESDIDSE